MAGIAGREERAGSRMWARGGGLPPSAPTLRD